MRRFLSPTCILFALALLMLPMHALDYPWVYLVPKNDSRDADMQGTDEAQSRNTVVVINQSESIFKDHITWRKATIDTLLDQHAPFCEMHFDAVKPLWLTPEEKKILQEYLTRGGFILLFIDTYPYRQDEFWMVKEWPVIDFLKKELPAASPDFTTGRATDAFPIFNVYYHTETADQIRHELSGNPNTCNRTLVFHQGRLCCFVMGQYGYLENDEWVPIPRPFPRVFSSELKSYQLIVNIYTYSISQ